MFAALMTRLDVRIVSSIVSRTSAGSNNEFAEASEEGEVCSISAVNYKDVFDLSIFDQTDFDFSAHVDSKDEDELHKALIQHLNRKKIARLEEVILYNVGFKMAVLLGIIEEGTWFWNDFLRPVLGALPQIKNIEFAFSAISKDEAKRQLVKLRSQIGLLRDGITKEPIYELEKTYAVNKRSIMSMYPALAGHIERKLLLFRGKAVLQQTKQLVEHALALPTKFLKIHQDKIQLLSSNDFFKQCDPKLLNKLKTIAHKFIVDSKQPNDSEKNNRGVYYFHGDPGTGKSRSVVELLKILGLPFFSPPIRSMKDLSPQNLEGQDHASGKNNAGLFAKTLLARNNTDGIPYLNAVLILDDFDRILFSQDQTTHSPSALTFLLDCLDPNKKTYFNPYFNTYLDISRLSIIVITNKSLPKVKPILAGRTENDPYTALRSRVTQVFFPNFSDQRLKTVLIPIVKSLLEKYNFTSEDYMPMHKYEFVLNIIDDTIEKQKKNLSVLEPRSLERKLEFIIAAKKLCINFKEEGIVEEKESEDYSKALQVLQSKFLLLSEEFDTYKAEAQMKNANDENNSGPTLVYSPSISKPLTNSNSAPPNTNVKNDIVSFSS